MNAGEISLEEPTSGCCQQLGEHVTAAVSVVSNIEEDEFAQESEESPHGCCQELRERMSRAYTLDAHGIHLHRLVALVTGNTENNNMKGLEITSQELPRGWISRTYTRVTQSIHWYRLVALVTLVLYCVDVGTDIATGVSYLQGGSSNNVAEEVTYLENTTLFNDATSGDNGRRDTWWGALTLVFAGLSLILTNLWTFFVYYVLEDMTVKSRSLRYVRTVFHIVQLGMLYMILHKLVLKKKSFKDENKREEFDTDLLVLRLLEGFVEAAPQLLLQLYIMTQLDDVPWLTALTVAASFSSLVWVARSVYKAELDDDDESLLWPMEICLVLWTVFTVAPRMVSLALFASANTWILFPVLFTHWIVSTVYYFMYHIYNPADDMDKYDILIAAVIIGFPNIFIFCPFDARFNPTNLAFHHILQFLENTILFSFWFVQDGKLNDATYAIPAAIIVWGMFPIGIVCLIMRVGFKK